MSPSLFNQSTTTNLQRWKKERHELLCSMSQAMRVSPFPEEYGEFHISLINQFCDRLLYYITANHFAEFGLAELTVKQIIVNQILATTKDILGFYDKYQNIDNHSLSQTEVENDLLITDLFAMEQAIA